MQKKVISIAILILCIFIVVVLIISSQGLLKPKPKTPIANKSAEPVVSAEMKLQNQTDEIINTKDFNRCKEINDATYQKVCTNNIALNLAQEKKDISFCQKMDNNLVPIEECERQTIFQKSIDDGNPAICNETKNQELQQECTRKYWTDSAIKKSDTALCDNIDSENKKNLCRDSYLYVKEYQGNETSFDCNKFKISDLRKYCEVTKSNPPSAQNIDENHAVRGFGF